MRTKFFAMMAAIAFAVTGSSAMAQDTAYVSGHHGQSDYGFGTTPYYRSLTPGEGYLSGLGQYARGLGVYNLNTSLAAINLQEARRLAIDNHKVAVANYYDLKQRNQDFRDANRPARLTMEELARLNKAILPARLSTQQFEPATRTIFWPTMLKSTEFAKERAVIEGEFAKRGEVPTGLGTDNHAQVREAAASMREKLSEQLVEIRPEDYVVAKKFLDSVTYESRFGEGTSGVATSR